MSQRRQRQKIRYNSDEMQRPITVDLIRKRSEHNSNLISNLEEIALHQEELTCIGTVLGKVCGKSLRILLLQNNVIGNLHSFEMKYFKVLEYLNLALNNLHSVTGLDGLINEHLNKIDLTLNFIDFDCLEETMDCLATLRNLKELFMMGNPCCLNLNGANASEKEPMTYSNDSNVVELIDENGDDVDREPQNQSLETTNKGWKNFRMYVIHKLPTLESLDGKNILRSERIKASQMQSTLEIELQELAKQCRIRKSEQAKLESIQSSFLGDNDEECNRNHSNFIQDQSEAETTTKHCPQDRMKLSNEMAMQKAEKEEIEKANQPKLKGEKDFEEDQKLAIEKARKKEEKEEGKIKQCNEGKWKFTFDEDQNPGHLTLDIAIQKHLSTSLVDVDVHPTYISVVIKSKVLRLVLPVEVKASESTAKRSLTTGHLLVTMPKYDPNEKAFLLSKKNSNLRNQNSTFNLSSNSSNNSGNQRQQQLRSSKCGLQETLLQEARQTLSGTVQYHNIVQKNGNDDDDEAVLDMVESSTRRKIKGLIFDALTDEPPQMF